MTNQAPNVVGKTFEEAKTILNDAGFTVRVLKSDNEVLMGTCDYLVTRVTLDLKDNKVTLQRIG